MAGSDLDPILQEKDGNDEECSSTADWSWICFHCHSSRRSVTPSVVCICRSLKSALYRRAFFYSTRLVGGTCNLEYKRQVVERPTNCRPSQPAADHSDDDGAAMEGCFFPQMPSLPRRFTYCECKTDDASASPSSSSASSSFPSSLRSMTSSDTELGRRHIPGSTCVECDNKSYHRRNDDHRPICINCLANIGCSSSLSSCGSCSRLKQKSNAVSRIPELQCNQQHQQLLYQGSQDNDEYNIKTATSSTYTRCKLQHRCYDDLKTLLDSFRMQVQAVSEDLVRLLEERHDLKQQIDMRNIAIEQLLRLQDKEESAAKQNQNETDAGSEKAGTILRERGQVVEDRTMTGRRDEQVIVRRTSEAKECFFTTLRTIRTIE